MDRTGHWQPVCFGGFAASDGLYRAPTGGGFGVSYPNASLSGPERTTFCFFCYAKRKLFLGVSKRADFVASKSDHYERQQQQQRHLQPDSDQPVRLLRFHFRGGERH